MRHTSLPPSFHADNRRRLAEAIGQDAVAIIDTADVLTRAGDFEYPYRPDSNFYYLTGIAEREAVLVLVPGHANPALREILFISGTSEFVATWEGQRHSVEEAAHLSGIQTVLDISEFDGLIERLLQRYQVVCTNAETSLTGQQNSPALRRARQLRELLPAHQLRSVLPQLAAQRMIKAPVEIERLRAAIELTGVGLAAVCRALRPDMREYELEAVLTAEFIRAGSTNAFMPIVAAGASATIVHHMRNDGPVAAGDLVLLDVGAEAGFYAADISRTFPVDRTFSSRQRVVYEAVYRLQQFAIGLLKPGLDYQDYEHQIGERYLQELVALKLITAKQASGREAGRFLRRYYPHRTSHFLGLDVHDVGDYAVPLQPGMVLTVEPGIYLREEGIGVRIEDVAVITANGCEVISNGIPSAPGEIEASEGVSA